jgi:hypothetical protein
MQIMIASGESLCVGVLGVDVGGGVGGVGGG